MHQHYVIRYEIKQKYNIVLHVRKSKIVVFFFSFWLDMVERKSWIQKKSWKNLEGDDCETNGNTFGGSNGLWVGIGPY